MTIITQLCKLLWTGGLVTSALLVDLLLSVVFLYAMWNFVPAFIRKYKLTKHLDDAAGPSEKHWFFGHNIKHGIAIFPIKCRGHTLQYAPTQTGLDNAAKLGSTHPTMFNFWMAPFVTSLNLFHSDTAISLLSSGAPKNELIYGMFRPWIGDGLLTSKGTKWKRNRLLLTPAFHFNILKNYAKVANQTVTTMLDKWDKFVGRPIDITDDVSLMTLDTMLKCAMSSDTNCQHVRNGHPYIKAIKEIALTITKRASTPYLLPDFIFWKTSLGQRFKHNLEVVHSHAEEIIDERRAALRKNSTDQENSPTTDEFNYSGSAKKQLDFLDILLQTRDEDGQGLKVNEIRDEVDTFLFEGHDTTFSGISWALYNLAKHPELQERCREDVKQVMENELTVKWNVLSKFDYLTMFIKESMRVYPPVVFIGRTLDKPMTITSKLNKYYETVVPKGADSGVLIYALHHNETMWENPSEFNPERFTKENIAKRPPHAYLPFSAGSRNCIGQNFAMNEMKIALAQTLQRYRLYLDEETPEPIMQPRLILQSKDGIHVKLKRLPN